MAKEKKASPYGSIKFTSISEYYAGFSEEINLLLSSLRTAIQQAAPKAEETISYNMPAFKQKKILVYYAAYKNHIGFYPTAKPLEVFAEQLTKYKTSKGAVQFALDKPLPIALIKKMVKFRLKQIEDDEKNLKTVK